MLLFAPKTQQFTVTTRFFFVYKPQSDPQVSQRNLHNYFNIFFVELCVTFHKQYLVYYSCLWNLINSETLLLVTYTDLQGVKKNSVSMPMLYLVLLAEGYK